MAQFSRFVLCQRRPGDGHTTGVLVLSGMNGKPLFCLQRVSIQPRAQYFSGEVNEAGMERFCKVERDECLGAAWINF